MKRTLLTSVAVATLLGVSMAFAADTTGVIKLIEATKHEVVLEKGLTYVFPTKVDLTKVKVGEKVKITFEHKNGKNEATAIVAAS
jgi:hypothetical protein